MGPMVRTVITGTGSHIPARRVPNAGFLNHEFLGPDQKPIPKANQEILAQFESITGIRERRYVPDELVASDIAADAARKALQSSGTDAESLDYIIVAHNFGDVRAGSTRSDLVPALAARVKAHLGIETPRTVAYDLIFGCPGWLQGVIQADAMIRAGDVLPPPGSAVYYLVSGVTAGVEGSLGPGPDGGDRPNAYPCPSP